MKIQSILQLAILTVGLLTVSGSLFAEPQLTAKERQSAFDLTKGVAIDGYDPVAYFSGKPAKGSKDFSSTYEGVTYHFANAKNKKAFDAAPKKYEPAYGGWCAWAMAEENDKVEVDPKSYKIVDGRLMLFYKGFWGDTRKQWNEKAAEDGEQTLVTKADKNWAGLVKG